MRGNPDANPKLTWEEGKRVPYDTVIVRSDDYSPVETMVFVNPDMALPGSGQLPWQNIEAAMAEVISAGLHLTLTLTPTLTPTLTLFGGHVRRLHLPESQIYFKRERKNQFLQPKCHGCSR